MTDIAPQQRNPWDLFPGPNAAYAQELYERYLDDPDSVDAGTRAVFERLLPSPNGHAQLSGALPTAAGVSPAPHRSAAPALTPENVSRVVMAARLARSMREYGHLAAHLDPLGGPGPGDPMINPATHGITDADLASLPATIVFPHAPADAGTCLDAINHLRQIYCGPLGYEFDHLVSFEERTWLHAQVESPNFRVPLSAEQKRTLLRRLSEVEGFERYLHTAFVGQKRFSIEGTDALVPMLDCLIDDAADTGTAEVLLGMAHRGRLNVLAHVLGKPYEAILAEFHAPGAPGPEPSEGSYWVGEGWTGDVKYHLGARKTLESENCIQLTLVDNPSHLEFVDPVVEGSTRAAQDDRGQRGEPGQNVDRALAVLIHGDAAFPGEGIVAETLNLSRLAGYQTGGTVHLIENNQLGFTTPSQEGRSTLYASDLAKGFDIPIVHVNADVPEACLAAVRLAYLYRERFHKDVLIDLVGYRRWGHNEGDEPAFTQPGLYQKIAAHPTVRALYARQLISEGVVTEEEAEGMLRDVQERLQRARQAVEEGQAPHEHVELEKAVNLSEVETKVSADCLRELNGALLTFPQGFTPNPRLRRVLDRRREALDKEDGVDWGLAESLALASILNDGTPIRLTGQDTQRGTFSQRHLVLHDPETGGTYTPLQAIPQAHASFALYNSPLSEAGALGFEYGYSIHAPDALVLWEAQFGDFANVAQTIIDQFIVAARAKWRQQPALALLLPHGYEGQGPEHSSARPERYLQLAAEDNIRVANPTTAAQYFHLLRLQAATLDRDRRPLVVLTPKSLLRHPRAASSLDDFSQGRFHAVLAAPGGQDTEVERLVLCSGKVGVDFDVVREKDGAAANWLASGRVELLYPFPQQELQQLLSRYPHLREVVWLQEEPQNMGAWSYIAPRLDDILPANVRLRYVGRPRRAATAEGSQDVHAIEQARLLHEALQPPQQTQREPQEVGHAR